MYVLCVLQQRRQEQQSCPCSRSSFGVCPGFQTSPDSCKCRYITLRSSESRLFCSVFTWQHRCHKKHRLMQKWGVITGPDSSTSLPFFKQLVPGSESSGGREDVFLRGSLRTGCVMLKTHPLLPKHPQHGSTDSSLPSFSRHRHFVALKLCCFSHQKSFSGIFSSLL